MKKKNSIAVVAMLAVMAVVCAAVIFGKVGSVSPVTESPVSSAPETVVSSPTSSVVPVSSAENGEEELPPMYRFVPMDDPLPKPDIFVENNTGEWNGFVVTLDAVSFSKDTQGMNYPTLVVDRLGEQVNAEGTLTSDHVYLLLTFTVENPKEYADTYDMGKGHPMFYIGQEKVTLYATYEQVIQNINLDSSVQDRCQYKMQPGETIQFTKGYIFPVEELQQVEELFIGIYNGKVLETDNAGQELHAWHPDVAFVNATEMFKEALHEAGF